MNQLVYGVEYLGGVDDFFVRHNAPRRAYGNLRQEFGIDAASIYDTYGKVYVAFSTGIDSQIIARSFIDMGIDVEYIFVHSPGYNDLEMQRVKECENFFNIKVNIISIDINLFKEEWIERALLDPVPDMYQYQFGLVSSVLSEDFPIVMQGANEPYIIGNNSDDVSIYRNKFENMCRRFDYMGDYRTVIDFPFSPESVASYYTDRAVKGYCASLRSYRSNSLEKNGKPITHGEMWNYYPKPIVKGQYFLKDIIWYEKITGFENYPDWFVSDIYIKETRVSVPYWDLCDFLENNTNTHKDYRGWRYAESKHTIARSYYDDLR